jgi:hypothetical protein
MKLYQRFIPSSGGDFQERSGPLLLGISAGLDEEEVKEHV